MGLEYVIDSIEQQGIVDGDVVAVVYKKSIRVGKDSKPGVIFGVYETKNGLGGFTVYPDLSFSLDFEFKRRKSFCVTFYASGTGSFTALSIEKLLDKNDLERFAKGSVSKLVDQKV